MRSVIVLFVLAWTVQSSPAWSAGLTATYAALQARSAVVPGIPVPEEGMSFACDVASWTLSSGTVRLLATAPDGRPTGFLFEGKGEFAMAIPDAVEAAQVRRFSGKPADRRVADTFTRMILRTSRGTLPLSLPAAEGELAASDILAERADAWLGEGLLDVDGRIATGLLSDGDELLWVDMETAAYGWLTFEFEPWEHEEVRLLKLDPEHDAYDVWVSLDRAEDRDASGKPGGVVRERLDLQHLDVDVDLTDHDGREWMPMDPSADTARFTATVRFTTHGAPARAFQFELTPIAEVSSVTTPDGTPLEFVRANIGERFRKVDSRYRDSVLAVELLETLAPGAEAAFVVRYEMKIFNFVWGDAWYPSTPASWNDKHTARMTFRHDKKLEVRAVGKPVGESEERGVVSTVWETERPTGMVGFVFGKDFREETLRYEGVPEVVVFGKASGFSQTAKLRNVGADVVNALNFYRQYFDTPLPAERMYVTRISAGHGQAFDGFLQLASDSFEGESPGATELFRAHEVAHQYWGHLVSWHSYRDQWLSEGLAEYSAMLFIEATMAKDGYFQQILQAKADEQLGRISTMGKFYRGWALDLRSSRVRSAMGPIGVGYRASSAAMPGGYEVQAYDKGAMVLHSLRCILRAASHSDDAFRAVLKEFLRTHAGGAASTADFARTVARVTGRDWTWFFNEWVDDTWIPTYAWGWKCAGSADENGRFTTTITVRQKDVPARFFMMVPARIEFGKDAAAEILLTVDREEKAFQVPLPRKPSRIVLAPDYAVLAKIEEL